MEKTPLLYQLSESMGEETIYSASLGDVFPASVADVEFGKLLPKLIDNTLTPEQFCARIDKENERKRNSKIFAE